MSTALDERPIVRAPSGGAPARRAVVRWAWRLFRREWRQQALVLVLLSVAVAATTAGAAVATNTVEHGETTITIPGTDPGLGTDLAAVRAAFPTADVVMHQKVAVPGSVATVDLRAQDPAADHGRTRLRLLDGRYPSGAGEVAMTGDVAHLFGTTLGGTWSHDGRSLRLVGLVENPQDLLDQFALVAPGQVDPPDTVTVTLDSDRKGLGNFRLPSGTVLAIGARSDSAQQAASAAVLALATIGLLFVGLVTVAGFTVMAQRRQRALGMLASVGATDRHVRLVMLANGAAVGGVAAVAGTAVGLIGWLAFAPRLETIAEHRIDRFDLPWWTIGAAMVLGFVTALAAAWWPARAASRVPVVVALSGRPPRPQPAHRFAAVGAVLVAIGVGALVLAHERRPLFIVGGVVATTLGLLLGAPLAIRALARLARRAPIAVRLAMRDLARYQARSGAALGAIVLAIGIAATIAISAAATQATADTDTGGNLPDNELVVHLASDGADAVVPPIADAQLQDLQRHVDDLAAALHAGAVVALQAAVNPTAPGLPAQDGHPGGKVAASLVRITPAPNGYGEEIVRPLYVATPELLRHYGIDAATIDANTDVVTSSSALDGLEVGYGPRLHVPPRAQEADLPRYSSDPNTLITTAAVERFGLQLAPVAWLVETPDALTGAQVDAARTMAASAGVSIETRQSRKSLTRLRTDATAIGILIALGVLAMTVGLIRGERANDVRTLTATGATSTTRRALTGATAGALGLLGALLGTAGAYTALVAWYHRDLDRLTHVPAVELALLIVGLPLAAVVGGWALAGREPPDLGRRPLD